MQLTDICKILSENNQIGAPIVDDDNNILGVIRYSDIIDAVAANKMDSTAEEFMREAVVTARDNISLSNGMTLLLQNDVTALILLDKNNEIYGIVSFNDMLKRLLDSSN